MNIAPISAPKTMMPAHAATQNVGRAAISRLYNGFAARRWRMTNTTPARTENTTRAKTIGPLPGTGAKLIARMIDPTRTTDRMPPRLSTLSVSSLTWAGTNRIAKTSATAVSGNVTKNTDPHQNFSSSAPAISGPRLAMAPPKADHRAIDFVRDCPDHSAVIRASVVG